MEAIGLLGRGPMKAQATVAVPLPSTGDDYESDVSVGSDDESRPLTQSELISRIMKGVSDSLRFNTFYDPHDFLSLGYLLISCFLLSTCSSFLTQNRRV